MTLVTLLACAHAPPLAAPLRSLDLPAAEQAARDDHERALVAAVAHLTDPAVVGTLQGLEGDGTLGGLATDWLLGALWGQERWPELLPRVEGPDVVSVGAFAGLPTPHRDDTGLPVVAPLLGGTTAALAYVDVRLGAETATFAVDTGAEVCVLDDDLATRLGLHPIAPIHVGTSTAETDLDLVTVPTLSIGALTWTDQPAFLTDLAWTAAYGPPIDGLLGWAQLRQLAVTFDAPGGRLVFERSTGAPVANPALVPANELLLRGRAADGTPLVLHLDSGSTISELFPRTVRRLHIPSQAEGSTDRQGAGGVVHKSFRSVRGYTVQLGPAAINLGWVVGEDRDYTAPVRVDGVAGFSLLKLAPICVDGAAMRFDVLASPTATCGAS